MNFVISFLTPKDQFMTSITASRLQEINKMNNLASRVQIRKVVTPAFSSSNLQK